MNLESNTTNHSQTDSLKQTKQLLILGTAYFLEQRLSAYRIRLNFEKILDNRFDDDEMPDCIASILKADYSQANFELLENYLNLIIRIHEDVIELFSPYLQRPLEELSSLNSAILITGFYWLLHSGKTPYKVTGNEHLAQAELILGEKPRSFIKAILIAFTKYLSPRPLARRLAMQGVYDYLINPEQEAKDIDTHIEAFNHLLFEKADREYYRRLMYGAIHQKEDLTKRCVNYLERPLNETNRIETSILILGTHELVNFPDVPYRVVINEYVELAKGFCGLEGYKFVNSVLDKIAHEIHG